MKNVPKFLFAVIALLIPLWYTAMAAEIEEFILFKSGEEGYSNYRIPSLITTKEGSLLACLLYTSPSPRDRG